MNEDDSNHIQERLLLLIAFDIFRQFRLISAKNLLPSLFKSPSLARVLQMKESIQFKYG